MKVCLLYLTVSTTLTIDATVLQAQSFPLWIAWLKTILYSLNTFYVVHRKLNRYTPNALMIHKECLSTQYILSCNHSKATKLTMWIGTKPEFSIAENVNHHVIRRWYKSRYNQEEKRPAVKKECAYKLRWNTKKGDILQERLRNLRDMVDTHFGKELVCLPWKEI